MAPGAAYGLEAPELTADAAFAAAIPMDGDLAVDGAIRLFALAAATGASGRLTVSAGSASFALTFRKGALEHAATSSRDDDLPGFLVFRGAVQPRQLAEAETVAGAEGDLVGALVTLKLVNGADLVKFIQEHAAQLVARAVSVEAGRWRWEPGVAPPSSAFPLGSPWALLVAAVRTLEAPAVVRRLGDREQQGAFRVAGRVKVEDLRLGSMEARVAAAFDGSRLSDLARQRGTEATLVLRVALLLAEVGLLAFGPPRAGAPAPPPAAPASAAQPPPPPVVAAPPAPASGAPPPSAHPPPPTVPVAPAQPARAPPAHPPRAATPAPARITPVLDERALQALLASYKDADHFRVLGVSSDATQAQVKIAYFQLAKAYHPDTVAVNASPAVKKLCADLFSRIGEAWGVLGEADKRAQYVEGLMTGAGVAVDVMGILQAETIFQEGTLLVKARQFEEAAGRFAEAIQLNPDEPEYTMWLAWCQFVGAPDKRKVHARAVGAIEAALKLSPRCVAGYLFLGQMAKIVGDLPLAERQLKRGLAVAPDHVDLQRELKYLRK